MAYIGYSEKIDANVWTYGTDFVHPEWTRTDEFGKVTGVTKIENEPHFVDSRGYSDTATLVEWLHAKVAEVNTPEQQARFLEAYEAGMVERSRQTLRDVARWGCE